MGQKMGGSDLGAGRIGGTNVQHILPPSQAQSTCMDQIGLAPTILLHRSELTHRGCCGIPRGKETNYPAESKNHTQKHQFLFYKFCILTSRSSSYFAYIYFTICGTDILKCHWGLCSVFVIIKTIVEQQLENDSIRLGYRWLGQWLVKNISLSLRINLMHMVKSVPDGKKMNELKYCQQNMVKNQWIKTLFNLCHSEYVKWLQRLLTTLSATKQGHKEEVILGQKISFLAVKTFRNK